MTDQPFLQDDGLPSASEIGGSACVVRPASARAVRDLGIEAVAWDIDGTLVDSEPLHHEALVAVCADLGVDVSDLSPDLFRGVHMVDVWAALLPRMPKHATMDGWIAATVDYYVAARHRLAAIEGAVETIEALAAMGIPQVCVSNSNRAVVDANIAALGIAPALRFSISLDDVSAGKPDPEPYLTAAVRLGLHPSQVLAVEDSRSGAMSARAAGLRLAAFVPGALDAGEIGEADLVTPRISRVLDLF